MKYLRYGKSESRRGKDKRVLPEHVERMIRMRSNGATYEAIGAALDFRWETCWRHLQRYGFWIS